MFPLVISTRRKCLPSRTQPKICPAHGQIEGQIMRKNKMIAKGCPKCDQQVPVACKACPCGYSFFNARRTTRAPSPAEDIRRRTQRVRREKPNYYDALEFDKQVKKAKTRSSECDNEEDGNRRDSTSSSTKIKKRKLKKDDEEEDDVIVHFSPEKQAQCSIILAEINRKMDSVMWKQP